MTIDKMTVALSKSHLQSEEKHQSAANVTHRHHNYVFIRTLNRLDLSALFGSICCLGIMQFTQNTMKYESFVRVLLLAPGPLVQLSLLRWVQIVQLLLSDKIYAWGSSENRILMRREGMNRNQHMLLFCIVFGHLAQPWSHAGVTRISASNCVFVWP